jgi:hyperosmotically inducible protein
MRALFRLAVLLGLVFAAIWLAQSIDLDGERERVTAELKSTVKKVDEAVPDLDVDVIVEELAATGRVVRRCTARAVDTLADATDDARTTAVIKTKIALDPTLSALDVSVDTTDGRVTLAGRVDAPADIARAIRIAFEQDEVREVVSTLQVRATREG